MKIIHRFGVKVSTTDVLLRLAALGINVKFEGKHRTLSTIGSVRISETDIHWGEAVEILRAITITEFTETEFSEAEMNSAAALNLISTGNRGYPQPEASLGYLDATYDLSEYCKACGLGLRQVRPFRFLKELELKRTVLQLNWVFDEFFVSREVWAKVFERFGVGFWPVVSHRTGLELEKIVQLRITHEVDVKIEDIVPQACRACGRPKAQMSFRGFAPEPSCIPAALFKSRQAFGPGSLSYRRVMASQEIWREIEKAGLRGLRFYPCAGSPKLGG
jgi:hypothetical protein